MPDNPVFDSYGEAVGAVGVVSPRASTSIATRRMISCASRLSRARGAVVAASSRRLSYGRTANPCTSTSASASQSRLIPMPAIAG